MWRVARPDEEEAVVEMCLELYREDPGPKPVTAAQVRRTLAVLRRDPSRGHPVILEVDQQRVGYALLIAFWSNELGGEICEVDELFVAREHRSKGYGGALFAAIESGELWPAPVVAIALGVTPNNARARRLYERLGFAAVGLTMVHYVPPAAGGARGAAEHDEPDPDVGNPE